MTSSESMATVAQAIDNLAAVSQQVLAEAHAEIADLRGQLAAKDIEIDTYIVDLVVNERLTRLGHQLNYAEKRAVITRLAGHLTNPDLGALIGMTAGAVLKIRKRTEGIA